jgi:hypothetical protein
LHEPLTVTSTVLPAECVPSLTSNAASEGLVSFSDVQFSGFAGWCTIVFSAYFNGVGNPSANSGADPSCVTRLIASIASIITSLPSTSLVGGESYFFSGMCRIVFFFLFYNQTSVGLNIGSEFIRVHDKISIIAVISPELCIVNQPMQPLLNGIASFANVVFSGFIGQCTINFKAYFHDSSNTPAAHEQSLNTTIRVIASSMTMGTKLQQEELVGGNQYSFTGNSMKDKKSISAQN